MNDSAIDIYCDESRHDLFTLEPRKHGKAVIGSLWMHKSNRERFKKDVADLRRCHAVWGEIKWAKISPSRLGFYTDLVDYFFASGDLRYRAIVVDSAKLDIRSFHDSDGELGFYKFYYQMLHHWMEPATTYRVYCDDKVNRDPKRLPVLRSVLQNKRQTSSIPGVYAVDSRQSSAVQMADFLTGAVQRSFNCPAALPTAKDHVIRHIESNLGRPINASPKSEIKFNIFEIRLQR